MSGDEPAGVAFPALAGALGLAALLGYPAATRG